LANTGDYGRNPTKKKTPPCIQKKIKKVVRGGKISNARKSRGGCEKLGNVGEACVASTRLAKLSKAKLNARSDEKDQRAFKEVLRA